MLSLASLQSQHSLENNSLSTCPVPGRLPGSGGEEMNTGQFLILTLITWEVNNIIFNTMRYVLHIVLNTHYDTYYVQGTCKWRGKCLIQRHQVKFQMGLWGRENSVVNHLLIFPGSQDDGIYQLAGTQVGPWKEFWPMKCGQKWCMALPG